MMTSPELSFLPPIFSSSTTTPPSTMYLVLLLLLLVVVQGAAVGASRSSSPSRCAVETFCLDGPPHWPPPCSCDPECGQYGDCCQDALHHTTALGTNLSHSPFSDRWSCRSYMSKYLCPMSVYMIDWCPVEAGQSLAAMCARQVSRKEDYTFLHDLPTQSAASGIVYNNVFCAKCHQDHHRLEDLDAIVQCIIMADGIKLPPTDHSLFLTMNYHPGKLRWTTTLTQHLVTAYFNSTFDEHVNKTMECDMYLNIKGQSCVLAEKTCAEGWPDDETKRFCASYTYHVYTESKTFKNWDCAVCNNVPVNDIKCSPHALHYTTCYRPPSSVNDMFQVYGDCHEPQIWNPLSRKCETISCGSLYKLVDGECVRDGSLAVRRFSINSSCFTRDYDRNLSLILPNLTVYLNETETTYNRGEYEFVDENVIRVCRPPDGVPALSVVSRVLTLISLVCMFLHMAIFLLQHRRSSIPRLTHFLMVLSLFIAKLLLLLTFDANKNYVACVAYGSITYYFFSVAFFWMNVISFDTCRAFCSQTYGRATIKTFLCYLAYATGVPLAMSTMAVVVDQSVTTDFVLHPKLGTDRCWFNNKWGLIAFFICPVFLILIINLILYIVSVDAIHRQQKSAQFASRSVVRRYRSAYDMKLKNLSSKMDVSEESSCSVASKCTSPSESERVTSFQKRPDGRKVSPGHVKCLQERTRVRVLRDRLVIYSKVALLMGMTWVFALVYVFVQSPVVAYLNVIFNCLQGTFIFIAFDCTKTNRKKLWMRLEKLQY